MSNHTKRLISNFLLYLFLIIFTQSCTDKPGGTNDDLTISNTIAFDAGSQEDYVIHGNETIKYKIVISNRSNQDATISFTEVVPLGSTYAGNDDFSSVCNVGDAAGTLCQFSSLVIPASNSISLTFAIKIDDPVTIDIIDNRIIVSAVDCSKTDCFESTPTAGIGSSTGFETIGLADWSETSVRKVLHTFAYGGLSTDQQITTWSLMKPEDAIKEILTFTYNNDKLSPGDGSSSSHASSLAELQSFWGSDDDITNPMRNNKRGYYTTLTTDRYSGESYFSTGNLQRTWVQAINTRGINPFLHKMGFFLTNYHMAIRANLASNGLLRDFYDKATSDLVSGQPFTTVINNAAKSAATARRYRHQYNSYDNADEIFSGNDDFAREYFQLFFRYNGVNEDIDYHEGVNIENNAKLLTGMLVDNEPAAYGSDNANDRTIAPIIFTDHIDAYGNTVDNMSMHHAGCLEIFHQMICGSTAEEKIDALSLVVSNDPEVLSSLPTYIVSFFADDHLTDNKKTKINASWIAANDDLLKFVQNYAISKSFHSEDTVKFRSTFNRNLTLYNSVVLNNEESFVGRQSWDSPQDQMKLEGGDVFLPAHDVFGGQTGSEAANNPNVFKSAYDAAAFNTTSRLARTSLNYFIDETRTTEGVWDKDWGGVIPTNSDGKYIAGEIADWLWNRIVGDGGKNFDVIARSQVLAMLSHGWDFGYAVTMLDPTISTDPDKSYTSSELVEDERLVNVLAILAADNMHLANNDITGTRRTENYQVNYAANFISVLPYTFAQEGK